MKGIATVLGLLLVAFPGHAESTMDVVTRAGLLGTCAESWAAGPARQTSCVSFYAFAGGVRRKSVRGDDVPVLTATVDSAERLTPTTVRLRLRNDDPNWGDANGAIYDSVVGLRGGKSQAVSSVRTDGTQLIKEGKFVASGAPTPVLQRCN